MDRPALGQLFADFASREDLYSKMDSILTDSKHAVAIDEFLAAAITQLGTKFNQQKNNTMDRLRDRLEHYLPRFSKTDLIKQQQNKVSFELKRMRWPALNTNIPKYRTWHLSIQCTWTLGPSTP